MSTAGSAVKRIVQQNCTNENGTERVFNLRILSIFMLG